MRPSIRRVAGLFALLVPLSPASAQLPAAPIPPGKPWGPSWVDGADPKENFDFKVSGLEKIWYTCQAQTAGDVCYQINFQIVKGPRYSFADVSRASGSNAMVKAIMERLRNDFPRAPFGAADH